MKLSIIFKQLSIIIAFNNNKLQVVLNTYFVLVMCMFISQVPGLINILRFHKLCSSWLFFFPVPSPIAVGVNFLLTTK